MAIKSTGYHARQMVLQVGTEWTTTQSGFDTGTRIVECDRDVARDIEPIIGISDREIIYQTKAGPLAGLHPYMFVTSVQQQDKEARLATMHITFRGQKTKLNETIQHALKAPYYETSFEQKQITVTEGVQITLALPVMQKTYLALSLEDLDPLNSPVDAPAGIEAPDLTYEGLTIPTPAYAGWRITARSHQTAGRGTGRRVIQVQDTITYVLGIA